MPGAVSILSLVTRSSFMTSAPQSNSVQPDLIDHMGLSLFIILLGSFIAPLLLHSGTLAIPAIASDLGLSAKQVSSFTLLQVLGNVMFVLPGGKLADKFGRRRIFCLGLLVAAISSLLAGIAVNDWMMLGSRALGGVGGALIFASAVALLMSVPPADKKVAVMGIYISVAYLGIVLGPVFGGLVLEYFSWRWVFLMPSMVLLVLALLGFLVLRWERFGDRNTRIRLLDFSLYAISLSVLAIGVFDAGELKGQILLVLGLLFFTAFCWFQTKRRDPLLQIALFTKSRTYTILSSSICLIYFGLMALPFNLTLYFQYLKGTDAKTTGFILLVQALCTAAVAPISGWLSERFRPRYLILTGVSMFVVSSWMLVALAVDTPIPWVIGALILLGLGFGILDVPLLHTAMDSVDEKLIGSASATMNGMRTMGGFFGLGLMSYLMGKYIGDTPITPAVYPELIIVLDTFFIATALVSTLTIFWLMYGVVTRKRKG